MLQYRRSDHSPPEHDGGLFGHAINPTVGVNDDLVAGGTVRPPSTDNVTPATGADVSVLNDPADSPPLNNSAILSRAALTTTDNLPIPSEREGRTVIDRQQACHWISVVDQSDTRE
jgi:hypothetical protein